MNRAIQQFEANLESARQLGLIYSAFIDKVTEAICLDELLRAEIVLAVGALDCYVHDVVRTGMATAFRAGQGEPNAYLNFGVSLDFVKRLLTTNDQNDRLNLFEREIRRLHGFRTDVQPLPARFNLCGGHCPDLGRCIEFITGDGIRRQ